MHQINALKIYISIFFACFVSSAEAQDKKVPLSATADSIAALRIARDTVGVDTTEIKISKDALEDGVEYSARDSMEYDIENKKIYLFGGASVKYTSINLEAGFIELDWENNIVTAEGILDSIGRRVELPKFKDGDQEFTANRMRYNFETQKGIVYDVTAIQQNLYVLGSKSKFVRNEVDLPDADSTYTQDIVYSEDAIFTTCNHPEPHFGIRSQKQKVIPGKLIVVGPSRLEIAGVPTPIYLPFAFFPVTEERTQGLIFPRGYEYSEEWGFGLRNIGYYVPISEYLDATASFNIYVKGTWGVNLATNFKKRYKFNGRSNIGYSSERRENADGTISFTPALELSFNYNQESAAHPTRRFGGSMNIQFGSYRAQNFSDAQSVLQGNFSSNLSYSQSFPGKPFSLSAGLTHSQNRRSGTMNIALPNLNFQTQTMYPFKRKKTSPKKEQWYEKIAFRYQGEARATFTGSDTLSEFFNRENLVAGMKVGARHRTTLNTAFRVLKNINVTPSINYTNYMNFQYNQQRFVNDVTVQYDTIINPIDSNDVVITPLVDYGYEERDTLWGFKPIHEYSASISANTALFRTLRFKKGRLKGLRHVVKPSLSFNYSPDYQGDNFGYTDEYIRVIDETARDTVSYSIFENSLYRAPSSRERMSIGYGVTNIYEAKIFSKKDSMDKKIRLMDNLRFSGNYNFAADSVKWSRIAGSASTRLFKGLSTLSVSANWDPHALGENGQRVDSLYWQTTRARTGKLKPFRFDGASFRLTTNISVKEIRKLLKGEDTGTGFDSGTNISGTARSGFGTDEDGRQNRPNALEEPEEALLDLFDNFRLSHNFNFNLDAVQDPVLSDSIRISTHTLSLRGSLQLTDKWSVRIGNIGYDFKNQRVTYPDFTFSRSLHCWNLNFSWRPDRNVYSIEIFVSNSPLDFIRIPYGRNVADGRFSGF